MVGLYREQIANCYKLLQLESQPVLLLPAKGPLGGSGDGGASMMGKEESTETVGR